jgi:hypothetical protein
MVGTGCELRHVRLAALRHRCPASVNSCKASICILASTLRWHRAGGVSALVRIDADDDHAVARRLTTRRRDERYGGCALGRRRGGSSTLVCLFSRGRWVNRLGLMVK